MESPASSSGTTAHTPAAFPASRPPLFVLLGALLLFFLRFGYDYGASDQDEIIPYLIHRMDPGLFTQDWFVQVQAGEFSVRTYFVWLLNLFSAFLPVWLATLILHVATWLLVAGAVYALARQITGDRLAAAASVVLALVFTPQWTLGGNELLHRMLVPSMLAWALALWAIYHFLRARYVLAPVLLGVACWMQALVGLHVAGLLILIRLVNVLRRERGPFTFGSFAMFVGLFALWSSPALGPILYQQLTPEPPTGGGEPSLFYILAAFRLPHHYLFFSFPERSLVRFGLLLVLGVALLAVPNVRRALPESHFVIRSLAIVVLLGAIGFVFTEIRPELFVAKLQLFKATVLGKLLLVIVLCGAASRWLPGVVRRPFEVVMARSVWSLAVVLVLWAGVFYQLLATDRSPLHEQIGSWVRAETDFGHLQAWVKDQTPHEAIFAVPPSDATFRTATHRTVVINYKSIPFEDDTLREWFRRLTDMAPIALPERGSPELPERLDEAYHALTADRLWELSQRYGFDHVIRAVPLEGGDPRFREVYRAGPWYVYTVEERDEPEA